MQAGALHFSVARGHRRCISHSVGSSKPNLASWGHHVVALLGAFPNENPPPLAQASGPGIPDVQRHSATAATGAAAGADGEDEVSGRGGWRWIAGVCNTKGKCKINGR